MIRQPAPPPTLYHYTCGHGFKGIGRYGLVLPAATLRPDVVGGLEPPHQLLALIAWFTDAETPDRDALGLTAGMIRCDRTTHRFRVLDDPHTAGIIRWSEFRGLFTDRLAQVHDDAPGWVADLERFGQPDLWWVSVQAVKVRYDPPA